MTQMLSRPLAAPVAHHAAPHPFHDPGPHLAALAEPSTRLAPFVLADGRALVPADGVCQHVAVTPDPVGGLLAQPQVIADMVDDLLAEMARQGHDPVDPDAAAAAERAAEDWLTQHRVDVAVWTLLTYGVHADVDTPVRARRFFTHAHLPPDAVVADAVEAAAATRISAVHEALRTGEFYRRMLDEAPRRGDT